MSKVKLYSSVWLYALAIALSVALAAFIFIMSSKPAPISAEQSGSIAELLAPIFVAGFEELDAAEQAEVLLDVDHVVRKIAHFCIYAFLGVLFTFSSLWHSRTWTMHLLLPWLFGALYAASDEIHQAFVPGRGPLVSDVILDSVGVLFGAVFALVIAKVLLNRKS